MPAHSDHSHHHHPPGQGHPPATIAPSLLRLSVAERLGLAALLAALVWAAVLWAMQGTAA
jgi:hypothetical protein